MNILFVANRYRRSVAFPSGVHFSSSHTLLDDNPIFTGKPEISVRNQKERQTFNTKYEIIQI